MSTTTVLPNGHLSMTPSTKPPIDEVHIVRVGNGWMVFDNKGIVGCINRPSFVFNDLDDMLLELRKMLNTAQSPSTR
ncbi:MAG: hypothetical protein HOO67_05470 [Candidatus Peribacteraceae bacterium]|nr:hypothetical protein [Candidatus Peribacteraceae bacterium]